MRYIGVDIGNSGVRIAELHVAEQTLGKPKRISWRYDVANSDAKKPDQPGRVRYRPSDPIWIAEIEEYLEATPTTWMISSVRRDALNVLQTHLQRLSEHSPHIVHYRDLSLSVNVESPDKVGIDRLLAALAAASLSAARPLIVIQAGSAVTVDLLTQPAERAVFEGGTIVPGVPMILRLLGKAADQLPELDADDLTELPQIPGKNTEQAMLGGAASALVGGVIHLVDRYRNNLGNPVPVILSGGDGPRIAQYIPEPLIVVPDLVQRGLLVLATTSDSTIS